MMNFFRKLIHFCWYFFAASIIGLACLLSIARLSMPLINDHRDFFNQRVSRLLERPVEIGRIDAVFHGFEPMIRLEDVSIDDANHQQLLHVNQLQFGLDLLSSVRYWKMVPSLMMLGGTSIALTQDAQGHINVIGFQANPSVPADAGKTNELLAWLFSQRHIEINNVLLNWTPYAAPLVPVFLKQLDVHGDLLHHVLTATISSASTIHPFVTLRAEFQGDFHQMQNLQGQLYLQGKTVPLPFLVSLFRKLPADDWQLINGHANIECWADVKQLQVQSVQARLDLHDVVLQSKTQEDFNVKGLTGDVLWQPQPSGGWQLQQQLQVTMPSSTIPLILFVQKSNAISPVVSQLSAKAVHLEDFHGLLNAVFPGFWKPLNPMGVVDSLNIKDSGTSDKAASIALAATFSDVSVHQWNNIPGVNHLSGQLTWQDSQGALTLDSNNATLDLGPQFLKPFKLDQFSTDLHFSRSDKKIWDFSLEKLNLSNPELSVETKGSLLLDEHEPLKMNAAFKFEKAGDVSDFLPKKATSSGLKAWLHAGLIGSGLNGTVEINGPLKEFPFDHSTGIFKVHAESSKLSLHYADGWPNITDLSTVFDFDGHAIQIKASSGDLSGMKIKNIDAAIALDQTIQMLRLKAAGVGDSSQLIDFLLRSPLKQKIAKTAELFSLKGPMDLNFGLDMPLSGKDLTPKTSATVHLDNNELQMPKYHLDMSRLGGDVDLNQEGLISSTGLRGALFGYPATLTLSVDTTGHVPPRVNLIGSIASKNLQDLGLPHPFDQWIQGSTAFNLSGSFPANEMTHLLLTSNVTGLSFVGLPPPFEKTAQTPVPLNVDLGIADDSSKTVVASLGDLAQVNYRWNKDQRSGGVVHLGPGTASATDKTGLWITGELKSINWHEWSPVIDSFKTTSQGQADLLKNVNLRMQEFLLYGQRLKKAELDATPTEKGLQAKITSDKAIGSVFIPADNQQELTGDFKKLFVEKPAQKSSASSLVVDPLSIPLFNIKADDFKYNDVDYGQAVLQLGSLPEGRSIKKLTLTSDNLEVNIKSGSWIKLPDGVQTKLAGTLKSQDLNKMLLNFVKQPNVVMHQANINFNLSWNRAPDHPSLDTMSGGGTIALGAGEINLDDKASSELERGKLLNILSLDSLPNRLTDLSSKGYIFNSMTGSFAMTAGSLMTVKNEGAEYSEFKGNVADIRLTGHVGLAGHDYNMDITVVPHVAGSLPIIAAVAGGPLAFGITWVASKAINAAVGDAAAVRYHLGGTWSEPTFTRVEPTSSP